jgi:hypothetical protein
MLEDFFHSPIICQSQLSISHFILKIPKIIRISKNKIP